MARKIVTDDFRVFSKRLSDLMKERNVTQEALAHALGIKRQTVSLYKNGQSTPDAAQLKKIATFFHVSADWLLNLSDYNNSEMRGITLEVLGFSESATEQIASIAGSVIAAANLGDQANKKDSTVNNPNGFTCQQEARAFLALNVLLENPEFVLALSNAWAYMRYTGQFDSGKSMTLGGEDLPEPFSASCQVLVDALWNRVAVPLRGVLDDTAKKVELGTRKIDISDPEVK